MDYIGALKAAYKAIRTAEQRQKADAFQQKKQELLLEMITRSRSHRGNAKRPQPNSPEFALCEALAKDGFLERDLMTGIYRLKDDRAATWR